MGSVFVEVGVGLGVGVVGGGREGREGMCGGSERGGGGREDWP